MRIVIITPLEKHHEYIISEIYKIYKNIIVIKDDKKIKSIFNTKYKNIKVQKNYENKIWFKKKFIFPKEIKIIKINDANKNKNINKIYDLKPTLLITSGANKLTKNFIYKFQKIKIVNLHGGDPDYYRGLDSLLWAIYHNEFHNLKVAIHFVDQKLDCGKIIAIEKIKLFKGMKLYQLRRSNVELTKKILLSFLSKFLNKKKILTKKNKQGKYYSFMPSVLKDIVEKKFNNFTKKL